MAGGIYPGRPFSFNLKCVVFSCLIAGGYWWLPPRRLAVLAFLVWSPYLALAWYDYKYDCRDKLEPTLVPFGRRVWLPFKPPGYQAAFKKMAAAQVDTMNRVDHLVGWTVLVAVGAAVVRARVS